MESQKSHFKEGIDLDTRTKIAVACLEFLLILGSRNNKIYLQWNQASVMAFKITSNSLADSLHNGQEWGKCVYSWCHHDLTMASRPLLPDEFFLRACIIDFILYSCLTDSIDLMVNGVFWLACHSPWLHKATCRSYANIFLISNSVNPGWEDMVEAVNVNLPNTF